MSRLSGIVGVIVVLLSAPILGQGDGSPEESKAVRENLRASQRWDAAFNGEDLDALMTQYTDDSVIMPPGFPNLVGKLAIQADYAFLFENYNFHHETTVVQLEIQGSLAVERGVHDAGRSRRRQSCLRRDGQAHRRAPENRGRMGLGDRESGTSTSSTPFCTPSDATLPLGWVTSRECGRRDAQRSPRVPGSRFGVRAGRPSGAVRQRTDRSARCRSTARSGRRGDRPVLRDKPASWPSSS